jgi:hypothetical protein
MVSMMMMMMMMGRSGLRAWAGTVAVGAEYVAGRDAVGAAPEFGSSTPAHILRIVRAWPMLVSATRVGLPLLLSLGRIQSKHVKQNGGDIRHHDEGDKHNKP